MTNHVSASSLDAKVDIELRENALVNGLASPFEIQGRFDTLRDMTPEQMTALNKQVVRKIDWRLMPAITVMFLMK